MGSQAAKELKHGYGYWLPDESPQQKAEREAKLVKGRCACTTWTLVAKDIGKKCRACGRPMEAIG